MKNINDLQLVWKKRNGGVNQTERDFLNFLIDGVSLSEKFGNIVSGIGCWIESESKKYIHRLILKEPADFPNNRRSLYLCPECGDLSYGAISILALMQFPPNALDCSILIYKLGRNILFGKK